MSKQVVQAGCPHFTLRTSYSATIYASYLFFDFESCHSGPDMHVHLLSSGRSCCLILLFSCHVLLTWLREISAVLGLKILISIHRCRCPKRSIELVSRVLQVAVVFIRLLGAAALHCPGSRQTSSQACIL